VPRGPLRPTRRGIAQRVAGMLSIMFIDDAGR
jgi:hypothetical protein